MPIERPEDFGIDKEKAATWAESIKNEWENKLSTVEKNNFEEFSKKIDDINEYLSTKILSGKIIEDNEKVVEGVEQALSKSKLPSDIFVYIKTQGEQFGIPNIRNELTIDKEKLGALTSIVADMNIPIDSFIKADLSVNNSIDEPVLIRLRLPKNSSLVPISEDTIISDRNKTIKINSISIVLIKGKEYAIFDSEFVDTNDFRDDVDKATNWANFNYVDFFKNIPQKDLADLQLLNNDKILSDINSYLNLERNTINSDTFKNQYIMSIDYILENKVVPQNLTVYAKFTFDDFKIDPQNQDFSKSENIDKFKNQWLGKIFTSQSLIKSDLVSYRNQADTDSKITIRTNVKSGSKGIILPSQSDIKFLLPRNSEFIIKNINKTEVKVIDEKGVEKVIQNIIIDANLIPKTIIDEFDQRKLDSRVDNDLILRARSLKSILPEKMSTTLNFGYAIAQVSGLSKSEYFAHSRAQTPMDIAYVNNIELNEFSFKPVESEFLTVTVDRDNYINTPTAWNRDTDTEFKILEEINKRLAGNKNAEGTITLYTDLYPCASCSYVIKQFKDKYPKIKINIIYRIELRM